MGSLTNRACAALWMTLCLGLPLERASGSEGQNLDLTSLSLQELMEIEVIGASKFPQPVTEAPAVVSVVSEEEIRAYGYTTLSDVLRGIRGLYIDYDRNYTHVGIRGFGRLTDYSTHVLLLVDGYRVNDNIYDGFYSGTDFLVDIDLIERVEFISGPGSAVYGSNAFFGVVNVITKRGRDLDGASLRAAAGSYGTYKASVGYGGELARGLELALQATHFNSKGQDLYFPELDDPATNGGVAENADADKATRLFGKLSFHGLTLNASFSDRVKHVPTASYGTVFNDPGTYTQDRQLFFSLRYDRELSKAWKLTTHLTYAHYDYDGSYIYDYPPRTLSLDGMRSRWLVGEAQVVYTSGRQRLLFGSELQADLRQDQFNFDVEPRVDYLDTHSTGQRGSVYALGAVSPSEWLTVNCGLRLDGYSTFGATLNPRLALILKPSSSTAFKLMYGTAFRPPNASELDYQSGVFKQNTDLDPETIHTYELAAEVQPRPGLRFNASSYYYSVFGLINVVTDPKDGLFYFENQGDAEGWGAEMELERVWPGGAHFRASYAWSHARDRATRSRLTNSPEHMAKLHLLLPLLRKVLYAGFEGLYEGERKTRAGRTGPDALANLTLTTGRLLGGLSLSASVYNVFDRAYATAGGEEHGMDVIPQDGRNFRVQLQYGF